jgi:hypothetical protein
MVSRLAGLLVAVCLLAGCGAAPSPSPTVQLTLLLRAGPVCPVVPEPPNPACEPRAVANEVVSILDGEREVARGTSDAFGRINFVLPQGRYTIRPVSDGGFPAPPLDQLIDLGPETDGVPGIELVLDYDTGIR